MRSSGEDDSVLTDRVDSAKLLIDSPADGAWNMSVDQMLLRTADQDGEAFVRFYGWQSPVLSLGYFQPIAGRQTHAASLHCPVVRRASGGGAIVHDQELTFSIALPSANRWSKKNNELYKTIHGGIVNFLRSHGIRAAEYEKNVNDTGEKNERTINSDGAYDEKAFLCFERRTDGDIVIDGHKVGGSAQRRSRKAILQHTSLLLRASKAAPELLGIEDLSGVQLSVDEVRDGITMELEKTLLVAFEPAQYSLAQKKMVENISQEMFGNVAWLQKK